MKENKIKDKLECIKEITNRKGTWKQTEKFCYVIRFGTVKISVHQYVGCDDVWFLSCTPDFFNIYSLESSDIEDAKIEAVTLVAGKLMEAINEYKKWKR